MPKFLFELPDNWKCNQCPYCQEHDRYDVCDYRRLHGSERFGRYLKYEHTDKLHPEWCPLKPLENVQPTYSVSYEGYRKGIRYQLGYNFRDLETARRYIAEMKLQYSNWHAFRVWEEIDAFTGIVYEEE